MLVSMIDSMKKAKEGGYCVPAFGVGNEVNFRAVLKAAENKNAPVIMLVMANNIADWFTTGRFFVDLAVRSSVPVSIILDHGATYEDAINAIRAGFSDIMIDRSSLPYEENVAQVSELVKVAHAVGVGVEGELGHVGFADDDPDNCFTNPTEAVDYVNRTGIDALAVAIGTVHGQYKKKPNLQFDLLKTLSAEVPVPLALHGGSGSGDENLRKACSLGIQKLNIAYDLYLAAVNNLKTVDMTDWHAYTLFQMIGDAITKKAEYYIDLTGATDKA